MSEHNQQDRHADPGQTDLLTGHNYDGIQEYDNPTPAWWTWVFIASVVFAFGYMFLTLVAAGDLAPPAEYERAYLANLKKKFGEIGELEADAPTILKYMKEEQWLALGKGVFRANCTSCHGLSAEGNSGPNMTDDHYIHVKSVEDIAKVIKEGAKAGAMPAWGNRLHPNEIVLVSSYIASLKGTRAPGGKAPEGEQIAGPWAGGAEVEKPQANDTAK